MNWKRLLLAVVAIFVAEFIMGLIFHRGILGETYSLLMQDGTFRPESDMKALSWVRIITTLVFCFFFVFIFVRGYESRGILEGVRYGFYIAIFIGFVMAFNMFVWFSLPYWLTWAWVGIYIVEFIIIGIITSLIYKPKPGA
ncbi:MAG: hypothetical protein GY839_20440 [candidate division Zixibacteria bacterium]|nr:hypothetical protein [candidate division Zixibacteria bacterium]